LSEPEIGRAHTRPLGPANVPGVGEPGVAVRAIARVLERAPRGPSALAVIAEAFPRLTADEARAAIHLIETDPQAVVPRVRFATALSLAVPLGLGTVMVGAGAFGALVATLELARGGPEGGLVLAITLVACAVTVAVGLGLHQLSTGARFVAGALSVLEGLLLIIIAARGERAWLLALPESFLGASLLLPAVGRWFERDGRAARAAMPAGGYVTAVASGLAVVLVMKFFLPAFVKIFAENGVQLPAMTELLIAFGRFVEDFAILAAPVLVLAPAPLLVVPATYERASFRAVLFAAIVAFGGIGGWIAMPLVQIWQRI
jgi:hypothetical protein